MWGTSYSYQQLSVHLGVDGLIVILFVFVFGCTILSNTNRLFVSLFGTEGNTKRIFGTALLNIKQIINCRLGIPVSADNIVFSFRIIMHTNLVKPNTSKYQETITNEKSHCYLHKFLRNILRHKCATKSKLSLANMCAEKHLLSV